MRRVSDAAFFAAFVAAVMVLPVLASASYVSISTTASAEPQEAAGSFAMHVSVANSGDEAAYSVAASVSAGATFSADTLQMGRIDAGNSFEGDMPLRVPLALPSGRYVVPLVIGYADANGYKFSSVAHAYLVYGTETVPRVMASVSGASVTTAGTGKLSVSLRNDDTASRSIALELYLPDELKTAGMERTVELGAGEQEVLDFEISNAGALAGSSYVVAAVAEYDANGMHYSSVADGTVKVVPAESAGSAADALSGSNGLLIAAGVGAFAAVLVAARKLRLPKIGFGRFRTVAPGAKHAPGSKTPEPPKPAASENKIAALLLVAIFVFAFVLRYLPVTKFDERLVTNWGDDWWFVGMARYFATYGRIPAMEPTYGGTIEFDYPPGMMLWFAALSQISGVDLMYIVRLVPIAIGAFTVVPVFVLGRKLTGNYKAGLLAAALVASSTRYISRTTGFFSEIAGHVLVPMALFFLYDALKNKRRESGVAAVATLAGLLVTHHLTSAVLLISIATFSFLLLVFERGRAFGSLKWIAAIVAAGLLLSAPFWIKLAQGGIYNIIVKEAYAREGVLDLKYMYKNMGIPQVFLGLAGIAYALYKRRPEYLLLLGWALPTLLGLYDRDIATFLFKDTLFRADPDLIYVFSPSLNTRYFAFLAPPLCILGASFFFAVFGFVKSRTRLRRSSIMKYIELPFLLLVVAIMPLPFNADGLYEGSGYGWIKWAVTSFVSPDEYEAAVWMRANLPDNVNILSDYESNEMILGVTAKTVANGGTLKASLPVGTIYTDHLTIYFTSDLKEAMKLIRSYRITHVFVSERMRGQGWFAIESNARFGYEYGSNMLKADFAKFDNSDCFRKVYDQSNVKIYEVNYGCSV